MKTIEFDSGVNSISVSPDQSLIICGGKEILRILRLDTFEKTRNFRVGRSNLNCSAQDIAWHPTDPDCILSAARNSSIVLWNLKNTGNNALDRLYKDHKLMVNRVKWHPTLPDIFISAAQDGFIRIWDRRVSEGSINHFNCNSEGARDASFSPQKEHLIGASFDSGSVQLLDWRKDQTLRKINAHKRLALTVDWHPLWPNHLASGGSDKYIKVWNSETGEAVFKVQAPEAVARVKWLPRQPGQIASASQTHDNNLYIWDIENPVLPSAVYRGHSQPIKDFLMLHDGQDSLITCSDEKFIVQQSLVNGYSPKADRPKAIMAVGSLNTVALVQSKASKAQLSFISMGKVKEKIQKQAINLKIKGDVQDCCSHNSEVSYEKGIWSAIGLLNQFSSDEAWLSSIVHESLNECVEFYTERGDLQTAACVANVLDLKGPMKEYSEMLKQLELAPLAVKLPVSEKDQEVFFKCRCGKNIEDGICPVCQNTAECSVCESTVKGLFSWCQGCGHGGHVAHLASWFKSNSACPTGCGHHCVSLEQG
jgi:hypothetical protein